MVTKNNKRYNIESRRREIIMGRLHGESTDSLSMRLGVSKECVSKAYRGLPKRPMKSCDTLNLRLLPADENKICWICLDYLDGASEETLMKKYGMSLEELMSCFYAVTDRISCYNVSGKHQKYVYSSVTDKRHALNLSMPALAKRVNMNTFSLAQIMKGWRYLPYEVADRLAKELDLSVTDICQDIVVIDYGNRESVSSDRSLIRRRARTNFCRAALNSSAAPSEEAVCWAYYMIFEQYKMEVLNCSEK